MILFKKVVFLKNIFINKNPWLHTLKIHTICKSLVEIGQKFMKVSLNHIDFTDFFDREMLTSSFSFPSTTFHPLCYLMRAFFRLKNFYKLPIFFVTNSIGSETLMAWIFKTSEFKFAIESF